MVMPVLRAVVAVEVHPTPERALGSDLQLDWSRKWLAYVAMIAAIFLFLQGFGLGGVIASFGLVFDLIGFVLFLLFVLVSSVIMLRRETRFGNTASPIT